MKDYLPLSLLQKPARPPSWGASSWLWAVFIGCFVGSFLLYFKPYGMAGAQAYQTRVSILFFGVISFSVALLYELAATTLISPKLARNWKIWHELLYYHLLMFLVATANGLYVNFLQDLDFNWVNYGRMITQTVTVGFFPIVIYALISRNMRLTAELKKQSEKPPKTTGKSSAKNSFIYAEAIGNYLRRYELRDEVIESTVVRSTLGSLLIELENERIIRCHRSYVVNLERVKKVTGNAQGLKLKLGYELPEVPVSRKMVGEVRRLLD